MPTAAICPDDAKLQQLLLGSLDPEQFESLGSHLLTCDHCAARAGKLDASDELTHSLRYTETLALGQDDTLVKQLQSRLHQLKRPHSAASANVAANAVAESTRNSPDQTLTQSSPRAAAEFPFLAPAQAADELGRLASYRVLKVLGQGGMGVVFQAEDPRLGRMCALKAMLPDVAIRPEMKERFLREARAAAQLEHDNIIPIFQVDEDRGVPFIAMPFLKGMSLEDWLQKKEAGRKPGEAPAIKPAEILKVGRQIARGLAAAHERGLIHRDIKPANIWLDATAGGRVKILDFGLARAEAAGQEQLTQSGAIMGTPAYMAPEQAHGEELDGRCDLFSLGVILYRMCTGELPFKRKDTLSTLMALATYTPDPPRAKHADIPSQLSDLVMQLLAKSPTERIPSAKDALQRIVALEKTLAPDATKQPTASASRQTASGTVPADAGLDTAPASVALDGLPSIRPIELQLRHNRPTPRRAGSGKLPARVLLAAAAGALALIVAGIVFFLPTPNGTIRVEINDPAIEVALTATGAKIKAADGAGDILVVPGEHGLIVKRGDLELETAKFQLKKGETVTVKVEFLHDKLVAAKADGTQLGRASSEVPVDVVPTAAGVPATLPEYELSFTSHGAITVPTLKLNKPGPITIEVAMTPALATSRGIDFYAGHEDGLHLRTFSATRFSARWGNAEICMPLGFVPYPDRRVELALVYDGKDILAFENGKFLEKRFADGYRPQDIQLPFLIAQGFSGRMHQVRVSNVARYSADYQPGLAFTADRHTLALYRFDEGHGDLIKDSSGNNHHGKIVGGSWLKSLRAAHWTPLLHELTYLDSVMKLPENLRSASVLRKMSELNSLPGETANFAVTPDDGDAQTLAANQFFVREIWPLAALKSLTRIELAGTGVVDFKPLSALPLTELQADLPLDNLASEEAIRSISTLKTINGLPVDAYVSARAKLRREIDDMAKASQTLSDADVAGWLTAKLREANPRFQGTVAVQMPPVKDSIAVWTRPEGGLGAAVQSAAGIFDLAPLRALNLRELDLEGPGLHDLTPVLKLPIESLRLTRIPVQDLTPLATLPLQVFHGIDCPIHSLAPLRGKPLSEVRVTQSNRRAEVRDLADVINDKLKTLDLSGIPVFDLSFLKGSKIEHLSLHVRPYFELDEVLLKSLSLKTLNGLVPAEFWRKIAQQKQADEALIAELATTRREKLHEALRNQLRKSGNEPQVQLVHDETGEVVEVVLAGIADGTNILVSLRAFPKLRKLTLKDANQRAIDMAPLVKLPLEEVTIGNLASLNSSVLSLIPTLKVINGKRAEPRKQ